MSVLYVCVCMCVCMCVLRVSTACRAPGRRAAYRAAPAIRLDLCSLIALDLTAHRRQGGLLGHHGISPGFGGKQTAGPYSGVTVVLQWCYSGVTVVLQWCYSDVTVVLQWCYSDVTVMLQWCHSGVTVVSQ
jgi:hypothetical protein